MTDQSGYGVHRARAKRNNGRNPFTNERFFFVPLALYDGWLQLLKPSAIIRYITLCRLSNYYFSRPFSVSLDDLRALDGISERAALAATQKLVEFGLISCSKTTRPFEYQLVPPSLWPEPPMLKPQFNHKQRLAVEYGF